MSAEKSLAIVLRLVDFSETSVITTIFTRDFGKIGALAKGAKRPKGPFEAALDLLAVVRVVFLRKSSDALDLLTEAKLERRFRAANRDLGRLYAGYYIAELLDHLTDRSDPHPDLFDAADEALLAIDGAGDVPTEILKFETAALRLLGHLPSLDVCVQCGDEVTTETRVAFGLQAGGVLCGRCRPGQRHVVSISRNALTVWQSFANAAEEGGDPPLTPSVRGELRGVLNNYLAHHLGRRLRMHDFLGLPTP